MNKEEVKTLITKTIASITFAHYNESLKEGTFQSTVDEMFQLNNLPRVKFPTKIVTEGITDLFNDSVKDDNVNMIASSHDQTTVDNVNKNQSDQESKVTESTKRNRDSEEFPTKKNEEKKKERKRTTSKTKHNDTKCLLNIHFAQTSERPLSHGLTQTEGTKLKCERHWYNGLPQKILKT